MRCVGLCEGFENNGVCDVPDGRCLNGTDCADCYTTSTTSVLIDVFSTVFFALFFIGACALQVWLRRRQVHLFERASDTET